MGLILISIQVGVRWSTLVGLEDLKSHWMHWVSPSHYHHCHY